MQDAIPPIVQLVSDMGRVIATLRVAMQRLGINIANILKWCHRRRRLGTGGGQSMDAANGCYMPRLREVTLVSCHNRSAGRAGLGCESKHDA